MVMYLSKVKCSGEVVVTPSKNGKSGLYDYIFTSGDWFGSSVYT